MYWPPYRIEPDMSMITAVAHLGVLRVRWISIALTVLTLDVAKGCAAVLVVFRHRSNLVRLQAGSEHRLGQEGLACVPRR